MTRVAGADGVVGTACAAVAASTVGASGPTRSELVAELAALVGAPHEARFIVDEALALGLGLGLRNGLTLGDPSPPTGPLEDPVVALARAMAARRVDGEPLQYVFGHWPFRRLDLFVDPRVLIPRPETEHVVDIALSEARRLAAAGEVGSPGLVIADAGTGSGAIALSLATELGPGLVAEMWATDASTDALAVAASNLDAVRSSEPAPTALPPTSFVRGNWLEPLPGRLQGAVDLVVSNPPYVSEAEWDGLAAEVRFEPRSALVAGASSDGTPGLADVEAVLDEASSWLRRPGAVVIEIAPHQADAAMSLAEGFGYSQIGVELDLARRPRALVARSGN